MTDVLAEGVDSKQPDGASFLAVLLGTAGVGADEGLEDLKTRCFRRGDSQCLKGTTFVDWCVARNLAVLLAHLSISHLSIFVR